MWKKVLVFATICVLVSVGVMLLVVPSSPTKKKKKTDLREYSNMRDAINEDDDDDDLQLYFPDPLSWEGRFTSALEEMLPHHKLVSTSLESLDPERHVIVAYPAASRRKSDMEYALDKVIGKMNSNGRIICIYIHMEIPKSLPVTSTSQHLSMEFRRAYDNLELILDVAYTKEDLMYDCEMNSTSSEKLRNFLHDRVPSKEIVG